MRRFRMLACCAAVLMSLVAFPTAAAASPGGRMVAAINAVRQANGLPPLRSSRSLVHSASRYSRWMIDHDFFGHQARIRASRRFDPIGEVLAIHPGSSAGIARTVQAWQSSPGHRAVLFSPAFDLVGAGRASGSFGGREMTVWTAHFGA